jgi:hypothetical protein
MWHTTICGKNVPLSQSEVSMIEKGAGIELPNMGKTPTPM